MFKNGFIWNIFSSLSLNSGLSCHAQVLNNSLRFLYASFLFNLPHGKKKSNYSCACFLRSEVNFVSQHSKQWSVKRPIFLLLSKERSLHRACSVSSLLPHFPAIIFQFYCVWLSLGLGFDVFLTLIGSDSHYRSWILSRKLPCDCCILWILKL